ncbi:MAG: hypothetical protein L0Y77_10620 [Chlorobi bacterium]|nr:hypothetical protein [Chlorobiota bacterium]
MKTKISKYRAEVIEKTIVIESQISLAITCHYFGHAKVDFLLEVLQDEYFNFGLKLNILKKTFPDKIDNKVGEKLIQLNRIRNIFAHNHNIHIYDGKKWVVVNPKNFKSGYVKAVKEIESIKGIDFEKKYKEFNQLYKELKPFLEALLRNFNKKKIKK